MGEVVGTFGGWDSGEEAANGRPERVSGACRRLPEQRLELGEQLLDRVEVRAVGRQVEDRGAGFRDRLAHTIDLVGREVVEHHDVAGFEAWRQELLDVGAERQTCHRPVEDQGRDHAVLAQPGDEGRGLPVPVRHGADQTGAERTAPVAPRHVGRGRGLVEEDEPGGVHEGLPATPSAALRDDVGPLLLGRSQGLFLCLRPSRRRALCTVESPT